MSRRAPGSASRARSRPVGHPACRLARAVPVLASLLTTSVFVLWGSVALAQDRPEPTPQPRESKTRVDIPIEKVRVDDGDTIVIVWGEGDEEIVRILGIDTPETQHVEHNIPYDQSFGREAKGFAAGAFGLATRVELLRGATLDPYGRTLGYFYVNGKNYSAAIVAARLAAESVSFYGDNGLPEPAQEVLAAAKTAGPVPFEPPHQYRRRMREVMEHETAH
jgi:endonuclease YncB( thermonuclease family)